MRVIFNWYHLKPTTIAFLDGIFISTAINMLTGIKEFKDLNLLYAILAICLLISLSVFLLISEQKANNLQEKYADWEKEKKKVDAVSKRHTANWNIYIIECTQLRNKIKSDKQYNLLDNEQWLCPVSKGFLCTIFFVTIALFVGSLLLTIFAYL